MTFQQFFSAVAGAMGQWSCQTLGDFPVPAISLLHSPRCSHRSQSYSGWGVDVVECVRRQIAFLWRNPRWCCSKMQADSPHAQQLAPLGLSLSLHWEKRDAVLCCCAATHRVVVLLRGALQKVSEEAGEKKICGGNKKKTLLPLLISTYNGKNIKSVCRKSTV